MTDDSTRGATATQILDVAQELAQTRGYNAFSYRDLAERVGIRSASIHHHFPGKSDLAMAIVARYREKFGAALRDIRERNGDAGAQLEAYVDLFRQTLEQDGRLCLCGMFAAELSSLPEDVRDEVRAFFAENERWLMRTLDAGRRKGELQFAGAPNEAAAMILDALEGALLTARALGSVSRFVRSSRWLLRSVGVSP
jgi:TetR/AcrR family transcriptional regulator, transcriptional repressor for nem operon